MSLPALDPSFRRLPARLIALFAFLLGFVPARAQTPPVIYDIQTPLTVEDGIRQSITLYADTSGGSAVSWRLQVGTRSVAVEYSGGPWFSMFITSTYHRTIGSIGPFVRGDHQQTVTLFATNAYGTTSKVIGPLNVVGAAPRGISIAPASQRVTAGSSATFVASTGGSPPFRYQWRRGGVNIAGATSETLLIRGVQPADAGAYEVVVTNNYGSSTATTALEVTVAPPVVSRAPAAVSVATGATAVFEVVMSGSPPFTFKWRKDRNDLPDTNNAKLTIANVQPSDAGSYDVIVTNSVGTVVSHAAVLTVTGSPITITEQPRDATVNQGSAAEMVVVASASGTLSYQWYKDGVAIPGATAARLAIPAVQSSAAGVYTVVLTSGSTALTSAAATLTVVAPPTISAVTSSGRTLLGRSASLHVSAAGTGPFTYQWRRNGIVVDGASQAALALPAVAMSDGGSYTVTVTNTAGSVTSSPVELPVVLPGRLINLSILTALEEGEGEFTLGVVLGGAGAAGAKPLLLRAAGPSLAQFGVQSFLADPRLEYFSGASKAGENDDWAGLASVASAAAQVGAFPLIGSTSKDAALLANGAGVGAHSVKVSAPTGGTGSVLAELYDASPEAAITPATPRVINLSVLKPLGSGLTAGFVLGGTTDVTVLVRVVGPGLAGFGVSNFAPDPRAELRSGARSIASNNDWAAAAALAAAFGQVGAFPLAADSKDAALLTTLSPGAYTVEVAAASGASGTVLVEVYEVPAPSTSVP